MPVRPDVVAVEIGQGLKIIYLTSGRASADAHFAHGKTTNRDRIFLALVEKGRSAADGESVVRSRGLATVEMAFYGPSCVTHAGHQS